MDFEQRIFKFIKDNQLIAPRGLVLVGVSGGADSMALLLALVALRHELGVQLYVAHFNHRLRPEADRDERFVDDWCKRLNVPLTVGRRQGVRIRKLSEEKARELRFEFLFKTAQSIKAQAVALAHTRNDLAETVLMRLLRGSGLYGLRAILPKRIIDGVCIVRPLLGIDRTDIEKYLKLKKVRFCTDLTNRRMIYERNKVRHKLLPLLAKEYNPRIISVLSDLASVAVEDYEYLAADAKTQFKKWVKVKGSKASVPLKAFGRQHPAISRLILRQMVESLTGEASVLGFEHIHALEDLALQQHIGQLHLAAGLKAVNTQKFLELIKGY